jgi:hypothetical protein
MALDRDRDGFFDRDEIDAGADPANPASTPANVAVDPGVADAGRVWLAGGSPNPFGPDGTTVLRFVLPRAGDARLEVFDAMGRRVSTVLARKMPAGPGSASWDGRDDDGREVGAGLYFYRLSALGERVTAKGMKL